MLKIDEKRLRLWHYHHHDFLLLFSLEESAKVLGKSVKDESVQVVEKKYGKESGKVFKDGLTSAGNATMTYMNIQSLGVKGLVKKTAKDTGKQLGKAVLEAHATGGSNEKKQEL